MPSPLIRSALVVENIDVSRRFYEEVIGLTAVYLDADLTETITWKFFGLTEGTGIRALILKPPQINGRPAPDFGMVGLFEVRDASLGKQDFRQDGVRFGESILVFYVNELSQCLERVAALGGSTVSGPHEFRLPHASAMEAIVRDPDGVAINLVEAPEAIAW
jgi:catechol 2,3-dioxygenase-like lactoylglutathione lyase family enzyme